MSEPVEPAPPPVRRRRRWLLLLVPLALVVGAWVLLYFAGDLRLRRAIAAADRQDPHWRLDDILAERDSIPDEDNAALTAIAVKPKMPAKWPAWDFPPPPAGPLTPVPPNLMVKPPDDEPPREPDFPQVLRDLKPNEALTDKELAAVRAEMDRAADALEVARRLSDQPRGRYPIVYSKDFITTLLPNIQDARTVAYLLSFDVQLRAQQGDLDGALASCRAILNAARSIGDEPSFIPQLVRIAIRAIAIGRTEQALALGEPSPDALAALQRAFAEDAEESLFEIALRGERAGLDRFMESLQAGDLSVRQLRGFTNGGSSKPRQWIGGIGEEELLYLPGAIKNNRAALLERMTRYVEIYKLPPEERAAPLAELKESLRREPVLVREMAPAIDKVALAGQRTQAQARCVVAGLAVERYRRKHGRWPEGLADLQGEFLRAVPADPFDGKPLRYVKDDAGVIVYSIGQDGKDDGGNRETLNTYKEGTDVGFRLWDVDKRKRPRK